MADVNPIVTTIIMPRDRLNNIIRRQRLSVFILKNTIICYLKLTHFQLKDAIV